MEDGFDTHELDDFAKDLLGLAEEKLPKETKKFIKSEATKLKTKTKNKAKEVGILEETGSYYKGFKSGKVYNYGGEMSCRAYNGSSVAHLLENGHLQTDKAGNSVSKGFVPGFHPFEKAYQDFKDPYYNDTEDFIDKMLGEKGL